MTLTLKVKRLTERCLRLLPVSVIDHVDSLSDSERGDSWFGSSGK